MLVSTVFGVDDDMKGMCDDLARRGCVASVPNFFFRDQDPGPLAFPTGGQRAFQRVERLDFAKSMEDLKLVLAQLRSHEGSNGKLVVLGFCFGGPHAWRSVCDGLGVGGAMSFHGTYVSKYMRPGDKPVSPIALHYGDKDELAPPQELAAVKKVADATGAELVVYPGVGHGYMLHSHMGHAQPNAEAAKKSWDRALHMIDTLRI